MYFLQSNCLIISALPFMTYYSYCNNTQYVYSGSADSSVLLMETFYSISQFLPLSLVTYKAWDSGVFALFSNPNLLKNHSAPVSVCTKVIQPLHVSFVEKKRNDKITVIVLAKASPSHLFSACNTLVVSSAQQRCWFCLSSVGCNLYRCNTVFFCPQETAL